MRRVNLFISDDNFDYLKSRKNSSLSEHIRRAIDDYIQELNQINVSASASENILIKAGGEKDG